MTINLQLKVFNLLEAVLFKKYTFYNKNYAINGPLSYYYVYKTLHHYNSNIIVCDLSDLHNIMLSAL